MKYFLMLLLFSAFTISLSAQIMISGKIIDKLNGKAIEGVHIQSSENTHTLSGIDGNFRLFVQSFPIVVKTQHLSYAPSEHTIVYQSDSVFLIKLTLQNIELNEVSILDGLAKEGDDPVALHTILAEKIQSELGDRPLPEVLNFTPGIFASRDGGGSGDASVQMRGFSQENISVLLNGIPINGAENGLIYWNNWMGLTEATSCIQVQKGIGASLVSSNSVGGTINILTEKPGIKGGSLSFQTTDYGNTKIGIQAHSGERKGISTDFLITKSSGPGYIDGTYVKGWAYFFNMRIRLSANQILLVNLLGGPEHHGQRNLKLSKTEVDTYGYQYNKEWGTQDGKLRNASENFYHKPFLSVNH